MNSSGFTWGMGDPNASEFRAGMLEFDPYYSTRIETTSRKSKNPVSLGHSRSPITYFL